LKQKIDLFQQEKISNENQLCELKMANSTLNLQILEKDNILMEADKKLSEFEVSVENNNFRFFN
jgi:hypothetical protein